MDETVVRTGSHAEDGISGSAFGGGTSASDGITGAATATNSYQSIVSTMSCSANAGTCYRDTAVAWDAYNPYTDRYTVTSGGSTSNVANIRGFKGKGPPKTPFFRAPLRAARTLNATVQARFTLSLQ